MLKKHKPSFHKNLLEKALTLVEVTGNKLPHPVAMFFYFFLISILLSFILGNIGLQAEYNEINRATGEIITKTAQVKNMLTTEGIRDILVSAIKNFTGHAALGVILVAIMGIGLAEATGLMDTLIKKLVLSTPKRFVSTIVVFTGVMSNIASDAGYVILVPLGAVIFASFGRHPLAGLAAAFAGVSGGFSANLLLGTTDPLLSGISTQVVQMVIPGHVVQPTCNWFFMFASTFLITIIGALVTDKIIEPRLGKYTHHDSDLKLDEHISKKEKKGLRFATLSLLVFAGIVLLLVLPDNAILKLSAAQIETFIKTYNRHPSTLETLKPLMSHSIVLIIMLAFFIPGVFYGIGAGTVKNDKDIVKGMVKAMVSSAPILVIIFVSAQFVFVFTQSNIGIVLAVKSADILKALTGSQSTNAPIILRMLPLVGIIFITAFLNLFMGGASSKWLMLSPVFIPLFVELGISPEYTQLAYRIGDSVTNVISPLMTYFPIIIGFAAKYAKSDKTIGLGTIIAMMLPYSFFFLIGWTLLFIVWLSLGIPIGPGETMFLPVH